MQRETGIIEQISDDVYSKLRERINEVESKDKCTPLMVPVMRKLSNKEKKKKRIKPNSFCVCGSGLRFKNCCRLETNKSE